MESEVPALENNIMKKMEKYFHLNIIERATTIYRVPCSPVGGPDPFTSTD